MKRVKILSDKLTQAVLLGTMLLLASSCTKRFGVVNTDKNAISTIGPAQLPFLFSKALDVAPGAYYNYQVAQNLFADQYCQYFACEATYFPSDRLTIRQDWVGAAFNPMYTDVMPQLQSIFAATDQQLLRNMRWPKCGGFIPSNGLLTIGDPFPILPPALRQSPFLTIHRIRSITTLSEGCRKLFPF